MHLFFFLNFTLWNKHGASLPCFSLSIGRRLVLNFDLDGKVKVAAWALDPGGTSVYTFYLAAVCSATWKCRNKICFEKRKNWKILLKLECIQVLSCLIGHASRDPKCGPRFRTAQDSSFMRAQGAGPTGSPPLLLTAPQDDQEEGEESRKPSGRYNCSFCVGP